MIYLALYGVVQKMCLLEFEIRQIALKMYKVALKMCKVHISAAGISAAGAFVVSSVGAVSS